MFRKSGVACPALQLSGSGSISQQKFCETKTRALVTASGIKATEQAPHLAYG